MSRRAAKVERRKRVQAVQRDHKRLMERMARDERCPWLA